MDKKNKNLHGNDMHNTYNVGHDSAKNKLANKLTNNGYDIYAIRKAIVNHALIKYLISIKACRVSRVIGNNFTVDTIDNLLCNVITTKNKNVTVIQTVNNICNSIMSDFKGYGKTKFWKNLDSKFFYNKRIYIGADILSLEWIKNNYSQTDFTCKLSDRKKITKYQG